GYEKLKAKVADNEVYITEILEKKTEVEGKKQIITEDYEKLKSKVADMEDQYLKEKQIIIGASKASSESIEDEVKQKQYKDKSLFQNDVLYTGMMYHEEKKIGYWRAIYSVVRDLEVLKQYISTNHPNAELGNDVDFFKFAEPNGKLLLLLETTQLQLGWTVDPDREPMELFQSTIDHFPLNPLYSSCSMSVYAEIGVAKKPLHCPIKLTGIDPSKIVYINKSPPALPPSMSTTTSSSSSTNLVHESISVSSTGGGINST
ncbi:PREDICTED: uncharacterized protein LOC109590904, partial [Amphimedon queenslandica]|uniref:Uncharacterized protein n=1 Tax=Amphimedon queenslandica TaxID=400682 RepID=A0AAN0JYK4_AMPQE